MTSVSLRDQEMTLGVASSHRLCTNTWEERAVSEMAQSTQHRHTQNSWAESAGSRSISIPALMASPRCSQATAPRKASPAPAPRRGGCSDCPHSGAGLFLSRCLLTPPPGSLPSSPKRYRKPLRTPMSIPNQSPSSASLLEVCIRKAATEPTLASLDRAVKHARRCHGV